MKDRVRGSRKLRLDGAGGGESTIKPSRVELEAVGSSSQVVGEEATESTVRVEEREAVRWRCRKSRDVELGDDKRVGFLFF